MKTTEEQLIKIIKKLKKKGLTLATAESITGGGIGEKLTTVPGASQVFLGGIISYSDKSKIKILGVKEKNIKKYGVVSEEVAIEMAQSARLLFKSDYAIATTGEAGPKSASGQKVGTVWVAIADKNGAHATLLDFSKTPGEKGKSKRETIRTLVISSTISTFSLILNP